MKTQEGTGRRNLDEQRAFRASTGSCRKGRKDQSCASSSPSSPDTLQRAPAEKAGRNPCRCRTRCIRCHRFNGVLPKRQEGTFAGHLRRVHFRAASTGSCRKSRKERAAPLPGLRLALASTGSCRKGRKELEPARGSGVHPAPASTGSCREGPQAKPSPVTLRHDASTGSCRKGRKELGAAVGDHDALVRPSRRP